MPQRSRFERSTRSSNAAPSTQTTTSPIMAEPRMRTRQKGQQFPTTDSKPAHLTSTSLPCATTFGPHGLSTSTLTPPLSRSPPNRLRRPRPPPQHRPGPRRDPNRLYNRNMPLRRAVSILLAPAEDQSRRLQMGAATRREETGESG